MLHLSRSHLCITQCTQNSLQIIWSGFLFPGRVDHLTAMRPIGCMVSPVHDEAAERTCLDEYVEVETWTRRHTVQTRAGHVVHNSAHMQYKLGECTPAYVNEHLVTFLQHDKVFAKCDYKVNKWALYKARTVRNCQSKETSILWSHQEETR